MTARAFVRFPHLVREVLTLSASMTEAPLGVVLDDKEDGSFVARAVTRLVDANDRALADGVRIGQRLIDATRFCPHLSVRVVSARRVEDELATIAEMLLSVVPGVQLFSRPPAWGLVCDVAHMPVSTARLLADIEALCARAGHACVVVAAQSARLARAASHRLARASGAGGSGRTRLVIEKPALVLPRLDLASLELAPDLEDALRALGVTSAAALRALVEQGGVDRLGAHAHDVVGLFHLDQEPVTSVQPTPRLVERLDLEDPIGALEPMLFVLRRLCERVCLRASARRERIAEMRLLLWRKRGAPTELPLAFPAPLVDVPAIVRAYSARLERTQLVSAVDAIELEATRRVASSARQLPLDAHARAAERVDESLLHLMAEMQAELGAGRAGAFAITDEVLPEKMTTIRWPPPAPRLRMGPPRRRRARNRPPLPSAAPTAEGRFLAAWPWPVRMLPRPVRLDARPRARTLLGLLEGEDGGDQPYRRSYAVLELEDGRRALALVEDETEELWLCGWFD